jgi:beta-xylosidase
MTKYLCLKDNMKLFCPILLALLPIGCFAQRPILPDFNADPTARLFEGELWLYPSHDIAGSTGWNMVDWHAFSSRDLVHWTDHGVIFGVKNLTWADKFAWAPDCISRNGKYYFYFPADFQIGVAIAGHPAGPFKDALGRPLIARNEAGSTAMDPCVFIDDDGQAYLYFGQNQLFVVKLDSDMVTRAAPIVSLTVPHYHEGIWVHKRAGLYYFSYPSNLGDHVANLLEYSTAPTPTGPFTYHGVIMDNRSRNVHHSIIQVGDRWLLFYHVQGPSPYERRVCVEDLAYNPDGSIRPVAMTRDGAKPLEPPLPGPDAP